jgi:hypothetical protein
MNEKVKQTLQKGKEIAMPVCIKAKALALQGFAKGNELMDRVSFLQKPLHKKIVWSIAGLFLLWVVFPLGEKSGSDTSEVRIGESNGSASANNSGFQKIR